MNNIKRREEYILHLLETNRRVSTERFCEVLGLAPSTIRRQLSDMEERGLLIRTHGGAVGIDAGREIPLGQKVSINTRNKRLIASTARGYIQDGDTIALGGGTTILELCYMLMDLKKAVVLTDSITAANILIENPNIELWINGGIVHKKAGYIIGPNATTVFETIQIDKTFLGAECIDFEKGIYSAAFANANVEQTMASVGRKVFVLADSSKMNRQSTVPFLPLKKVDYIITDQDCDPDYIQSIQRHGVEMVIAGQAQRQKKRWKATWDNND